MLIILDDVNKVGDEIHRLKANEDADWRIIALPKNSEYDGDKFIIKLPKDEAIQSSLLSPDL